MIEVEKKFQPTEAQLAALLKDSEFVDEKLIHDVYYDYSDYRLHKKNIWIRKRDGFFELKIGKPDGSRQEIEDKKDIELYFGTADLESFIKENLQVTTEFDTKRREYQKDDVIIDVDELSFGYNLCEIEIMVETQKEVENAKNKIINLARKYNFEIKKVPEKRKEYYRLVRPEIYKKLYPNG